MYIPGFEGLYSLSDDLKRVYSHKSEKNLTISPNKGYLSCCLFKDGKKYNGDLHLLVYCTYHGVNYFELDCHIDHFDRDRKNNSPSNLRPCTKSENNLFRYKNISKDLGDTDTQKVCRTCLKSKDRSEFYDSKVSFDGKRSMCKSCVKDKYG